jgi:hypothetical protein
MAASPTLCALVAALDGSDVIVHVSFAHAPKLDGHLAHQLVDAGGRRYLRIVLAVRHSDRVLIPILAHELQHALEVAQAPDVRDAVALIGLYQRIGVPALKSATARETEQALRVQRQVRADLRVYEQGPPGHRLAQRDNHGG